MADTEKKEVGLVTYIANGLEVKLSPSIVQNYIVGNGGKITMPEYKFFVELCRARGLNPFLKEAYCIKYGNTPATIVVSKDVIEQRAETFKEYDGKESGIIVQNKETGEITERAGCFWIKGKEELLGGWCKVYRKDRKMPEYMSVTLDEVAARKSDGSYNTNWTNKPATMVEKVAKVRALRAAFPKDLCGMYITDEMPVTEAAKAEASKFEEDDTDGGTTFTVEEFAEIKEDAPAESEAE